MLREAGFSAVLFDRDRPLAADGAARGHPSPRLGPARCRGRPGARPARRRHRGDAGARLARLSVDDRGLWRPRRRLGRRDRSTAADRRARPPPGRRRAGLARSVARPRRAGPHLPARRHLRARPQRVRRAARRHRKAHRQARPGLLAHPCRGSGERADRLDRAAAPRRRLQCLRRRPGTARGGRRLCRRLLGIAAAAARAARGRRALADGAQLL